MRPQETAGCIVIVVTAALLAFWVGAIVGIVTLL